MKLSIIDRYIARELITSFAAVIFVLLIIVLSTEVVHLLSWVSQGFIPLSALLAYLTNSMFEFGVILIPLSLLMAILLAFGRLYRDSEMAALQASGVGPWQLLRPLMLVAIPITLLLLVLLLYINPLIKYHRAVINAELKSRAEVDSLLVGQFNRSSDNAVLFLESEDEKNKRIRNVFFHQKRDDINQEYGVLINQKRATVHLSEETKSTVALWNSAKAADQAELQWRLTLPVATIIVAFMALPLSYTSPRSGRYAKLALALIIYLLYSNMLNVSETWIVQQKIPVWVGTWWVHIIAIMITLFLFWRHGYFVGINRTKAGRAIKP